MTEEVKNALKAEEEEAKEKTFAEFRVCGICGKEIEESVSYYDYMHSTLCAECLLNIHRN